MFGARVGGRCLNWWLVGSEGLETKLELVHDKVLGNTSSIPY